MNKRTYSKKYKGEYITIMQSRYGNWGVFLQVKRYGNMMVKK